MDFYHRLGFGTPPQLGFPGAAAGRLRPYRSWRPIEQATMAYGHGISVSLIQLARAYTIFAGDGELAPLTLVKSERVAHGEKLISAETARAVRAMLEAAVQSGGTGPRPASSGGASPAKPVRHTSRKTAATPQTSTLLPLSASRPCQRRASSSPS